MHWHKFLKNIYIINTTIIDALTEYSRYLIKTFKAICTIKKISRDKTNICRKHAIGIKLITGLETENRLTGSWQQNALHNVWHIKYTSE